MLGLLLAGAAAAVSQSACTPSSADLRWLDEARSAWRLQLRRLPELTPPRDVSVILFDGRCRWSSPDALERRVSVRWSGSLHGGRVRLADGSRIPVGVTSFAGEGRTGSSFVMALPSIWTDAKVPGGPLGLDRLTKAVLLHEASHVAQPAIMARVGKLVREKGFGEDFNDDSIQKKFEGQAEFAASVREETKLLFAAAAASDEKLARSHVRSALELIAKRRSRWFVGPDRRLGEAEDLFLSMEGAGQYVGYSWLLNEQGGGMSREQAMAGFGTRARWWSQAQGLALVLAVERLGLAGWRGQLWGKPTMVGTQLLEAAIRT
jgi:hypothetical protein